MDFAERDLTELFELGPARQAQLEALCPQPELEQRRDVAQPKFSG
jgi:hypothetical protein